MFAAAMLLACGPGTVDEPPSANQYRKGTADNAGVSLIREYVVRDFKGERLRANSWFMNAVVWQEESAYDGYALVSSVSLTVLSADSSTARVRVGYVRQGFVRATEHGVRFDRDFASEETVFTAVLTDAGWRIAAPQLEQHVGVAHALRLSPFTPQERELLNAVVTIEPDAR